MSERPGLLLFVFILIFELCHLRTRKELKANVSLNCHKDVIEGAEGLFFFLKLRVQVILFGVTTAKFYATPERELFFPLL